MKKEKEWKRFLEWVNGLSPWNLWYPHDWSKKEIEKRRLSSAVEKALEELLNPNPQEI